MLTLMGQPAQSKVTSTMCTLVFRLPFFRSISCTLYQRFSLDISGRDFSYKGGGGGGGGGRALRSIGMRNRSSAASRARGDQQVLAAEGCSYAAAFKLAKNHDKHIINIILCFA